MSELRACNKRLHGSQNQKDLLFRLLTEKSSLELLDALDVGSWWQEGPIVKTLDPKWNGLKCPSGGHGRIRHETLVQ